MDQSASIGYYQARQGREMLSSLSATCKLTYRHFSTNSTYCCTPLQLFTPFYNLNVGVCCTILCSVYLVYMCVLIYVELLTSQERLTPTLLHITTNNPMTRIRKFHLNGPCREHRAPVSRHDEKIGEREMITKPEEKNKKDYYYPDEVPHAAIYLKCNLPASFSGQLSSPGMSPQSWVRELSVHFPDGRGRL